MEQPIRRRPRRKPKRKTPNSKQLLIAGCVIGAVALIVAACIFLAGGQDGPAPADPERGALKKLTINALTRDGETMIVENSYLDVEFPYAFSDLIQVEAINQGSQTAMAFTARIGGVDRKIYTIWFNSGDGQRVGVFDLEDGEKPVQVTVAFYEPDADLEENDRVTFFATQETVNDVIASMKENKNFYANN